MEKPWKVVAAFLGVFVAGAVFGGFFAMGVGSRWVPPAPAATPVASPSAPAPTVTTPPTTPPTAAKTPNPQVVAQQKLATLLQLPQGWQAPQLMRRYTERLDLTSEQKERVSPLIQRAAEDYRRLQQNTFRETAIILQRLQQDIAKELTPDQREKLEKMEEEQREKIQKMEQRLREQKKAPAMQRPGANRPGAKMPAERPEPKPADTTAAPPSSPNSSTPVSSAPAASSDGSSSTSTVSTGATSEKKE